MGIAETENLCAAVQCLMTTTCATTAPRDAPYSPFGEELSWRLGRVSLFLVWSLKQTLHQIE